MVKNNLSNIGNLALSIIQDATGLTDFEEARYGWELQDITDSTNNEFVDHCDFCHAAGLESNYIITYPKTHAILRVGSKCIKGFILFGNTTNQEDSNRLFKLQCTKIMAIKSVNQLLKEIFASSIKPTSVYQFKKICATILNCSMSDTNHVCNSSLDKWKHLLKTLKNNYPESLHFDKEQYERIRLALLNPKQLPIIRPKASIIESSMIKKRHRIITTLSHSTEYRNPSRIYEDKEKNDERGV
jgi:hypothetical protein